MTFEWEVFYSPNNSIANSLMSDVRIAMELKRIQPFTNSKEMRNYLIENEEKRPLAAVAFDECISPGDRTLPKNLKFDIIFPSELRYLNAIDEQLEPDDHNWQTNNLYPLRPLIGLRNHENATGGVPPGYYTEKFVALQSAISLAFIKASTSESQPIPTISLKRFPHPPMVFDNTLTDLHTLLPVVTFLAFACICSKSIQVSFF